MTTYKNRLFVCGPKGYVSSFLDEFDRRAKNAGLFGTFITMPKHLQVPPAGNLMQALAHEKEIKDWCKENWGVTTDVFRQGMKIDKESMHRNTRSDMQFTFYSSAVPEAFIRAIAEEYAHLNFELWSESQEANHHRHIAFQNNEVVRDRTKDYQHHNAGYAMDTRFTRYTYA